jgi:peptidoglycan hydrolase-like protein with peptidoglycan-binding domain
MNISSKLTSTFTTATPPAAAPAIDAGVAPSSTPPAAKKSAINQCDAFDAKAAPASTLEKVAVVVFNGPTVAAAALLYGAKSAWDLANPAAAKPTSKPTTTPPPSTKETSMPELKKGMKSDDVMLLQGALREAGVKVAHDGDFGGKTEAAVLQFQKAQHPRLKETGIADAATWDALKKAAPKAFAPAAQASKVEAPKVAAPATQTADGTPIFKQSDARWGTTLLGPSKTRTLGQAGCLVSSISMSLSKQLGREVHPDEVNKVMLKGGGFLDTSVSYEAASKAIKAEYGVDIPMFDRSDRAGVMKGADIATFIDDEMKAGRTAILHVDTDPTTNTDPNHYVLVNRKEGNEYVVLDPGTGDERRYSVNKDGNLAATEKYYPTQVEGEWVRDTPIVRGYVMTKAPEAPKKAK